MGQKLTFWIMVMVASIIGLYGFKMIASKTNMPGLQTFAEAL